MEDSYNDFYVEKHVTEETITGQKCRISGASYDERHLTGLEMGLGPLCLWISMTCQVHSTLVCQWFCGVSVQARIQSLCFYCTPAVPTATDGHQGG